MFDLKGTGFRIKTAWVGKDDALLAFDTNGNGSIDGISELFGSPTTNGFTYLAAHDSNNDGVIDSQDADYSKLLLWRDVDSDGVSTPSELITLTAAGISSISLAAKTVNLVNNGNPVTHRSSFTRADGSTGTIDDVWFQNKGLVSQQIVPTSYVPSITALTAPTLASYGVLNDFRYQMDSSAAFTSYVTIAVNAGRAGDLSSFDQAVENVLWLWSGQTVTNAAAPTGFNIDTRDFNFLKAAHGGATYSNYGFAAPGSVNSRYLNDEYNTALESMAGKFLVQVAQRAMLDGISDPVLKTLSSLSYSPSLDVLVGDVHGTIVSLSAMSLDSVHWDEAMRATRMLVQTIDPSNATRAGTIADALVASGLHDDKLVEYRAYLNSNAVIRYSEVTHEGISDGQNLIYAISSANVATGGVGNDVLIGGEQAILAGGSGDDTYIYRAGSGGITIAESSSNTLSDGGTDTLLMAADISLNDVSITNPAGTTDVQLHIGQDIVTLKGQNSGPKTVVEKIVFSDGTIWTAADLFAKLIIPTDGDDVINGNWQSNTLRGGLGNDTITGNGGADVIIGGTGDDTLTGGSGSVTFRYALGDGHDTINKITDSFTYDYTIAMEAGIAPADVAISQTNNHADLLIALPDGGSMIVKHGFDVASSRMAAITFSDGTTWTKGQILQMAMTGGNGNDDLKGTELADVMNGGPGNDTLDGGLGNDSITGGTGDDIIKTGPGDDTVNYNLGDGADTLMNQSGAYAGDTYPAETDKIVFGSGIAVSDVKFTQANSGQDLVASLTQGGSITITGGIASTPLVGTFLFADGTSLSGSAVVAGTMIGTAGDDVIYDTIGNDVLQGGKGNDVIHSGSGTDVFKYDLGDGRDVIWEKLIPGQDTVMFGPNLTPSSVHFTYSTDSLYAVVARMLDGGSITMKMEGAGGGYAASDTMAPSIETFSFADGTSYTMAQVETMMKTPTAINDVLRNVSGTVNALDGNDIVYASGVITVDGGAGEDTIYGNSSADTISGGTGNDLLVGGAGNDVINGGDGNDTIYGNTVGVLSTSYADEMHGGAGDDYIYASAVDINVTGDAGIDTLDLSGAVTAWTIDLSQASNAFKFGSTTRNYTGFEKVVLGAGADTIKAGADTVLIDGGAGNDIITGSVAATTLLGGLGDDRINGGTSSETIHGNDGNDTIYGGGGNDVIYGDYGNNIIYGDDGSDLIQAGVQGGPVISGNTDIVYGGAGNDTIYDTYGNVTLDGGDGNDTFYAFAGYYRYQSTNGASASNTGTETLKGGAGDDVFVVSTLGLSLDGGTGNDQVSFYMPSVPLNITVTDDGTSQTVTAAGVQSTYSGIESFALAASKVVGDSIMTINITGGGGDNYFGGGVNADLLSGGGGNDTLYGYGGNDMLDSGDGNDRIFGGDGADTITGGTGDDWITDDVGGNTIDGGTGSDTVEYTRSGVTYYTAAQADGSIKVTMSGSSAYDILKNVEFLKTPAGTTGFASPIVLDLDGNGVHLMRQGAGAHFDMDGDGVLDDTGWISHGDGMLFIDRNTDGSPQAADISFTGDSPTALTDLQGLAAHDQNGDGLIDAQDDVFSQLKVWLDNGDGVASPSEIVTLASLGIASISLMATGQVATVALGDNLDFGAGTFTTVNGTTGQLSDVALAYTPGAVHIADPVDDPWHDILIPDPMAQPVHDTVYA